jgi:hypothetical protein
MMDLTVSADAIVSKGGAGVSLREVPLTGFGPTREDARREAERGLRSWCLALARQGVLQEAANRARLRLVDDGEQEISVTVQV